MAGKQNARCRVQNYSYNKYELTRKQAEPETPGVVQLHDAAGVVAGVLPAAFKVHREGEVKRVADGRPDDVANKQQRTSHYGEIATNARHHVEQDQRQPPHRQSCPVVNIKLRVLTYFLFLFLAVIRAGQRLVEGFRPYFPQFPVCCLPLHLFI